MMLLSLRHDIGSLCQVTGIIRNWIKTGVKEISLDKLEEAIEAHKLKIDSPSERAVVVYMDTIKKRRFDVEPDYKLDWRELFEGGEEKAGHAVVNAGDWNLRMLPELVALEKRINSEAG